MRKPTMLVLTVLCAVPFAMSQAMARDKPHRLVLQLSDNDAEKMTAVLNVAANVSTHYAKTGKEVEIKIVTFNAGLHMLRTDTSPVKERIGDFSKSMPNVTFHACGNTMQGMAKREGKSIPILENATVVPAGVVTLMELNQAGWTIVRP